MKLLKDLIIATISIGSLSYIALLGYLYLFQEKIIFKNSLAPKEVNLPKEAKILFLEEIEVAFIDKKSDTTLFYFGGNANNAFWYLNTLKTLPCNIVSFNYPGYANSKGKPSQEAIFKAALKVFDTFKNKKNILVGRSLGSAVAAYVVSQRKANKLILITPFHSIKYLAKNKYPLIPINLLLKHPFKTYEYIKKVKIPTYVILAQKDSTTPIDSYLALKKYIKNLKETNIKNSTHTDILEHKETFEAIKRFCKATS